MRKIFLYKVSTGGPRLFVHNRLSPLIHLSLAKLDFGTQLMNKHFELLHSGASKLGLKLYFVATKCQKSRCRWLCGLRCQCVCVDGWMSVVSVVYCQVEISLVGQSLVPRSTTVCFVSKAGIT